jgi:hypothetical protein
MRIDVKGRNLSISDDVRAHVEKRFRAVSRQVSELAVLELELYEERNPSIADRHVAEAPKSSGARSSVTGSSGASGASPGPPGPRGCRTPPEARRVKIVERAAPRA